MTYMKNKVTTVSCLVLLLVSACTEMPSQVYYNRGDPENLLSTSSEVVNIGLTSTSDIAELSNIINDSQPTLAIMRCSQTDALCAEAKNTLDKQNVNMQWADGNNGVTLVYERIITQDCENRYIDNSINPYNLSSPTFGCSLTGNMVQMVGDKRQFTSPNLLDFQDGVKASQVYDNYKKPPSNNPQNSGGIANSMLSTVSQ